MAPKALMSGAGEDEVEPFEGLRAIVERRFGTGII